MLPLATSTWDENELKAIHDVIASNMYSMGARVAEFEKAFAEFAGSTHCVMVNSGSSANLIAIAALMYTKENQLKAGDEVIVPAVSWSTTYYPLHQYGLKLKFVDIDIETMNIDIAKIEKAVTPRTKAILAVNLLGNPCKFNELKRIADLHNLILIEDNCESLGATYQGRQAGTFGLMGTYSSFFSHHISTMEGGMVVTDDEELYHILLCLRAHGWTRNLPVENHISNKSGNPFYESFRFVLPGYNVRPLEMSGALGLQQLKKLPSIIQGRRDNAKIFVELFSSINKISIQKEIGASSWFGFALIFESESERGRGIDILNGMGVDCRPIVAGNFTKNEVIKYFNYEICGDLNASDRLHHCGLFIGNHHYSISAELKSIADKLKQEFC